MRVRYTRRAVRNLEDIFEFIVQENPAAAARVVDRIESVVAQLARAPEMGVVTSKSGIRRFPVVGYPYLVFYEIIEDEIAIVHIRHGARRPWASLR
jgi:toxin ParE1/3/4